MGERCTIFRRKKCSRLVSNSPTCLMLIFITGTLDLMTNKIMVPLGYPFTVFTHCKFPRPFSGRAGMP